YVERNIGLAVADDFPGLFDDGRHAEPGHLLGMDDCHAGFIGELPKIFGRTAYAYLDSPRRIEHSVQHRVTERAAVMELGEVEGTAGVAMRIDMDEADRRLPPDRLEDRMRNRVIATDRKRQHAGIDDLIDTLFDVLMAGFQPVAAAER